jgi:hypothetical protein
MFKLLLKSLLGDKFSVWLSTRLLNPGAKVNAKVDKVLGDGVAEVIEGTAAQVVVDKASK